MESTVLTWWACFSPWQPSDPAIFQASPAALHSLTTRKGCPEGMGKENIGHIWSDKSYSMLGCQNNIYCAIESMIAGFYLLSLHRSGYKWHFTAGFASTIIPPKSWILFHAKTNKKQAKTQATYKLAVSTHLKQILCQKWTVISPYF